MSVFDFVKHAAKYIFNFFDFLAISSEAHIVEAFNFCFLFAWNFEGRNIVPKSQTEVAEENVDWFDVLGDGFDLAISLILIEVAIANEKVELRD